MKMLTKISVFTLCAVSALSLVACKKKTTTKEATTKSNATTAHVHNYNKEIEQDKYLATKGACLEYSTYYKSCSCGEKGTATFTGKNLVAHNIVDGECKNECGIEYVSFADALGEDMKITNIVNNKVHLAFSTTKNPSDFYIDTDTLQSIYNDDNGLDLTNENRKLFIKNISLYESSDLTKELTNELQIERKTNQYFDYYRSKNKLDSNKLYYLVIELDEKYNDYYDDFLLYTWFNNEIEITGTVEVTGKVYDGQQIEASLVDSNASDYVQIQYTKDGYDEWSIIAPSDAGDYCARIYCDSESIPLGYTYDEDAANANIVKFTISQKEITVNSVNVTYNGTSSFTVPLSSTTENGLLETDDLNVSLNIEKQSGVIYDVADIYNGDDWILSLTGVKAGNYTLKSNSNNITSLVVDLYEISVKKDIECVTGVETYIPLTSTDADMFACDSDSLSLHIVFKGNVTLGHYSKDQIYELISVGKIELELTDGDKVADGYDFNIENDNVDISLTVTAPTYLVDKTSKIVGNKLYANYEAKEVVYYKFDITDAGYYELYFGQCIDGYIYTSDYERVSANSDGIVHLSEGTHYLEVYCYSDEDNEILSLYHVKNGDAVTEKLEVTLTAKVTAYYEFEITEPGLYQLIYPNSIDAEVEYVNTPGGDYYFLATGKYLLSVESETDVTTRVVLNKVVAKDCVFGGIEEIAAHNVAVFRYSLNKNTGYDFGEDDYTYYVNSIGGQLINIENEYFEVDKDGYYYFIVENGTSSTKLFSIAKD